MLEVEGVGYPAIHRLDELVGRIPASNPLRPEILPLTRLTPAAVRYRYPTASGKVPEPPPSGEIEEDLARVKSLLPAIRNRVRKPP